MTNPHSPSTHQVPADQMAEPDVIDVASIVRYAIGLAVVTLAAHVAMVLMFNSLVRSADAANAVRVYPLAADEDSRRPPEPRLQGGNATPSGKLAETPAEHNPGPKEALRELRAEEDAVLGAYAWVDRNAKIVRLPVAEAMKLTLQRGLPARSAAPAPQAVEQGKDQGK